MGWGDESHRRDDRGALRYTFGVLALVLILAAGAAVYAGWVPGLDGDDATGPAEPVGPAEPPAVVPGIELAEPAAPAAVLDSATDTPPVSIARLRAALQPELADPDLGREVGLVVQDPQDPSTRWQSGAEVVTPASTLKLLTAATALQTLGPEHRFRTTVVTGGSPRDLVLVGGGDPLLTDRRPAEAVHPEPATLTELARLTAARLAQDGVRRVRLSYDTTLFTGPAVSPTWEPGYLSDDVVSPITALWVDEGREVAGYAARSADPAQVAADRFAAALADEGVRVVGGPAPGQAPAGAEELAAVESAPLVEIVQHTLEVSDNEAAEVLLRQAAIATGRPGSFAGGVQTMRATLSGLGVDLAGAALYDGSGLSRANRLPVQALVDVLALAADPAHPELSPVVTTLPVAGFTGSLAYRFVEVAPGGLGQVRAKTGTLTNAGVHGLAGLVVSAQGRPLVFAVVADQVRLIDTLDARAQLDVIASVIATCACS